MAHAPLNGPRLPARSGNTKSLVILIHGYGANGNDLIDLGEQWSPLLPDTAFVSPDAPEACPMAPMGRQWFPLTHNPGGFRDPSEYWGGVRHAEDVLQKFIDDELADHGLTEKECAIVGFSQGTMMALHVGLRRETQLAGIVGYSGVLCGPEHLADTLKTKPPVLLVHGEDDPVVPAQALPLANKALSSVEIATEWHLVPGLGHGIDPTGFHHGGGFLKRVLYD